MPVSHASDPPESHAARTQRVHVLLPLPLGAPYDYLDLTEEGLQIGDFVSVPLGRRVLAGVVWGLGPADPNAAVEEAKLKPVLARLAVPAMPEVTRRFIAWIAEYACAEPGAVLRMAMSVPAALEPPQPRVGYALAGPPPDRMTPARHRVIAALADGPSRTAADLARFAGVSNSVVTGLIGSGTLGEVKLPPVENVPEPDWRHGGVTLTAEQQAVADALVGQVAGGGYGVTLLDGVTGAGKTEVYLEAVAAALEAGRQVVVMLPEIALTAPWLERFTRRFGVPPVAWHSDLRSSERRRHWRAVAEGRAKVVVGARSALFLPYADLGLIVVDEEHDPAFKQDDGVAYQARDMAVARAAMGKFPAVLVSATPSLESLVNVEWGRYQAQHLPNRIGAAVLPEITAIDMRKDAPARGDWLSPVLLEAMTETLEARQQTLLFLNRRGYAPLILCRTCGHRLGCPNCTAWLVEHRFRGRLICHHCGYSLPLPEVCPECGDEHSLASCGPGVERILEEVARHFPHARALVVASDTVHGPTAAEALFRAIAEGEYDIIVGTQIMAKGHHFPNLTLVGVVDADLGLNGGDLRAAERTYQLMNQVSGRAGRAAEPGRAFLQTYVPEHPVMQALISGERERFLEAEKDARRAEVMPPFGRLVALIVSGPDQEEAAAVAQRLARAAPSETDIAVYGPAPAPLALLRGRFRFRLLLKTARRINASAVARDWVAKVEAPRNVRVAIDVDPYSFM